MVRLTQISKIEATNDTLRAFLSTQIGIKYRDASGSNRGNHQMNVNQLKFDLTAGYNEQILAVRLALGNAILSDKLGQIYHNDTLVGELNYTTGEMTLSSWSPSANQIQLQSLATTIDTQPISHVCFRTANVPLRAGSFSMTIATLEYGQLTLKADEQGNIQHEMATGKISYDTGFVNVYFMKKTLINPDNHAQIKAKDWYSADLEYSENNKTYINEPIWVKAESVRYNAIAYSYIPLDQDILGLSATRLPLDGRVPIFRIGDIGIICAEKTQLLNEAIAGKSYTLADQRLSFVELSDAVGKIDPTLYSVDYEQGIITLGGDFAMKKAPLTVMYRYQDMGLIRDVQINGMISFTKPILHEYQPEHSIIGSALVIGDMQANYKRLFTQVTWNNVFDNIANDDRLSANYNDALYPITITNKGAISERWAFVFIDNTNFRIIGEHSGQIGTGNINEPCSPINPITQVPYFTISQHGWGSGWISGNTLRFDTVASMYPIWCIRTIKQSEAVGLSDQFQLMLRGDIDR